MSVPALDDISFKYTAVDRTGRQVKDVVKAKDARAAARSLAAEGLTPLSLVEEKSAAKSGKDRDLTFAERVAVLRQIALMVEAGVGLLEALQTVTGGVVAIRGRVALEKVIAALKRGEAFAAAMQAHAPGYPFYVYAMSRVGEATGQLSQVLSDAAEQMSYENRLRREFRGALTYPALLMTIGVLVVFFIFTQVVPKFSAMVGDKLGSMPLISRVVFKLSAVANAHLVVILVIIGALVATLVAAIANARVRQWIYSAAHGMPVVGALLKAREIAAWARLLGFALDNGVLLLDAAALARSGAPEGPFKRGLEQFERDLKSGVDVDASLGRHTELELMDLSLLRAGQKSGKLARMFLFVADRYDGILKDRLKTLTAVIEPMTIGLVAILVGTLAIAIMLSLVSVYSTIT
jgi:general secretion pathway protein F